MKKKVLSFLLCLAMLAELLPVFAHAEDTGATLDNSEVTVAGTNGFGSVLADEIAQGHAQQQEQAASGYTITDLVFDGSTASVTFDTMEEATLVVALYSEDGQQLLTSGKATVTPENTTASVTIEGEMPAYFMATAYLLDSYDMSPLCPAYDTPMYTRAMQELLASTVEDYDTDRVLRLDGSKETNFAVYSDDVKIIEPVEGMNRVVLADDAAATYIIENADEQITGLQIDDVFSYSYGENQVMIVRVADISIDGTTVTVTGGEADTADVFSAVKIQSSGQNADITVDDSSAAEGITYVGLTQPPQARSSDPWTDSGLISTTHEFDIGVQAGTNSEYLEGSISIVGAVKEVITAGFEYYLGSDMRYMRFFVMTEVHINTIIKGSASGKLPMGEYDLSPVPGLYIGFRPKLVLEYSGAVTVDCVIHNTIGFSYNFNTKSFRNLSRAPSIDTLPALEATLTLGIDWEPTLALVLVDKDIFTASLSLPTVFELSGKVTGSDFTNLSNDALSRHSCKKCLKLELSFKVSIGGALQVFEADWLTVPMNLTLLNLPALDAYYSYDLKQFDFGDCPNFAHRITIDLTDRDNQPAAGVEITALRAFTLTETQLGATNRDGILVGYLPAGNYRISAQSGDCWAVRNISVAEPGYTSLRLMPDMTPEKFPPLSPYQPADRPQSGSNSTNPWQETTNGSSTESAGAVAAVGTCGTAIRWKIYENGLLHIYGSGDMPDFRRYSQLDGIVEPWYVQGTPVTKIVIDEGITSIGNYAFDSCDALTSVTIPSSVTRIGDCAFTGCAELTDIELPEGLTYLGAGAFYECRSLENISIPSGITSIFANTFASCTSLRSLWLPDGITDIGSNAFYECSSLSSLTIPNSVERAGSYIVLGCSKLPITTYGHVRYLGSSENPYHIAIEKENVSYADFTLHPDTKVIAGRAFTNCYNLMSIFIPEQVISIGNEAFSSCSSLESVLLSDGITSIGSHAFGLCQALASINLPHSIQSIGNRAFAHCSSLSSVSVPEGMSVIETGLFLGCTSLTSVTLPDAVTRIGAFAFINCTNLENIIIPNSVTAIEEQAFSGCSRLESISIPDSVTRVNYNAFEYCTDLAMEEYGNVYYLGNEKNPYYLAMGRVDDVSGEYLLHPDTKILGMAFYGCPELVSITIPQGVETIDQNAFSGCSNLVSVTIPDSVTVIEESAFSGCSGLTSITLPASLTELGPAVFSSCTGLTQITLPEGITSVSNKLFYGCSNLYSVHLPSGIQSIGEEAFYYCEGLTSIIIPENVTYIAQSAFYLCTKLNTITLPAKLFAVGGNAFYGCSKLKTVYFTGSLEQWLCVMIQGGNEALSGASVYYNAPAARRAGALSGTVDSQIPTANAVYGGSYGSDGNIQTAYFEGLAPDKEYVVLALANPDVADPLSASNLLFIDQATSSRDGTLSFQYILREDRAIFHVMACGPSTKDLTDAYIYFPDMTANGKLQTLRPEVWYDGELLTEGQDYILLGQVDFTKVGEYTCYIRGIYNYTGRVECTYSVISTGVSLSGSVNTENTTLELLFDGSPVDLLTADDAYCFEGLAEGTYTLRVSKQNHVTREYAIAVSQEDLQLYPVLCLIGDINGDGKVNIADVSRLYAHIRATTLITDEYSLACANVNGNSLNISDCSGLYSHIKGSKPLYE